MAEAAAAEGPREEATAVVLNLFGTGLGIARNLGRRGVKVVGLSSKERAPGEFSRFCEARRCPDSLEEPERLKDFLLELAAALPGRKVLFPTRDADVLLLDRHRGELEGRYLLPQPPHEILERIMNKELLAAASERCGVRSPRSLLVRLAEADRLREADLPFPAVLKPVYANQWRSPAVWSAVGGRKGIRVERFAELRGAIERLRPILPEVLLQEWIPGGEDQFFIVGAVLGAGGRCLGAFSAQKVLQFPPDFGLGSIVRERRDEALLALGIDLLRSLDFRGIAEVEFKRDARDGSYRLIEINPRHWDQHTLGTRAGVNLSHLLHADTCGIPLPEEAPARPRGREAIWLNGEGLWGNLKDDLRRGRLNREVLRAVLSPRKKAYAFWDAGDPRPFLSRYLPLRSRKK